MYVIEVRRDGGSLRDEMAEMRRWIDDQRVEPTLFQFRSVAGVIIFELRFATAPDAMSFAQVFGGRLPTAPRVAA
jgi:hypothetical protein